MKILTQLEKAMMWNYKYKVGQKVVVSYTSKIKDKNNDIGITSKTSTNIKTSSSAYIKEDGIAYVDIDGDTYPLDDVSVMK